MYFFLSRFPSFATLAYECTRIEADIIMSSERELPPVPPPTPSRQVGLVQRSGAGVASAMQMSLGTPGADLGISAAVVADKRRGTASNKAGKGASSSSSSARARSEAAAKQGDQKEHENSSQIAFRSGLRSPVGVAVGQDGGEQRDESAAHGHSTVSVTQSLDGPIRSPGKPFWRPTNVSPDKAFRGSDSLSRSWAAPTTGVAPAAEAMGIDRRYRPSKKSYSPARSPPPSMSSARTRASSENAQSLTAPHTGEGNVSLSNSFTSASRLAAHYASSSSSSSNAYGKNGGDSEDLVPIGAARLSQLCKEDKAKVAKLIAQVTQLRHENESLNESSMSLNISSESSSLTHAQKEKLEHDVRMAEKKLGTIQSDNKRLMEEAELVQQKYTRSLEMLKQYQDRLVSLSEEKESLSDMSRIMQATEADAESRMVGLETEVATLRDSLAEQKAIVESHVDIENRQEKHVRDLEEKLSKALKKAAKAAVAASASKREASTNYASSIGNTSTIANSLKRPRVSSPSNRRVHHANVPQPIPSADVQIPTTSGDPMRGTTSRDILNKDAKFKGTAETTSQVPTSFESNIQGVKVVQIASRGETTSALKDELADVKEKDKSNGASRSEASSERTSSRVAQMRQQDAAVDLTPRTKARKRLTTVTRQVVKEIERELVEGRSAAVNMKLRRSQNSNISKSKSSPKKKKKKKKNKKGENRKQFEGPPPALITSTTPGPGFRPPTFPAPPVVNSIKELGRAYGFGPQQARKSPERLPDEDTWQRLSGGMSALPSPRRAISPNRTRSLGHSSSSIKYAADNSDRHRNVESQAPGKGADGEAATIDITKSTRENLLNELKRAQAALSDLRAEQNRTRTFGIDTASNNNAEESEDLVNLGEVGESLEQLMPSARRIEAQKRKKKKRKKKPRKRIDGTYSNRSSRNKVQHKLDSPSKRLSESIHFYDDSLVDLIDSVEHDESLQNMSLLSSIGFEDDDVDGESLNGSSDIVDVGQESPRLYIAAAPHPRDIRKGKKGRNLGGRRKREHHVSGTADVDPDTWWRSVGRYLNRKGGQKSKDSKVKVMRAGGRRGDYWGMFPSPSRTPRSFARRFDRDIDYPAENFDEGDVIHGERYDDEYGSARSESKGEPVYNY